MANNLVAAGVQLLLEKALSLSTARLGLVFGLKKDMDTLQESIQMILAVLNDADSRQKYDSAVRIWLERAEEKAYDVDRVLDELNYELLRRQVDYQNQQLQRNKVCLFFSCCNTNLAFHRRVASEIRSVTGDLRRLNLDAISLGLGIRHQIKPSLPAITTVDYRSRRETHSVPGSYYVGRTEDEAKILEMLLSRSERVVSVLPIVGMGGIGKTALVKSIYNNRLIDLHFEKKIWVCLAKQMEIMELFKFILESLTWKRVKVDDMDVVLRIIEQELGGKRYLLVLDDPWNYEQGFWDDFFTTLAGLNTTIGSWSIVTTRLEQVAKAVSGDPFCLLGRLSDDACWSLVKEKVITVEGEVPEELEEIKRQILRTCDGLPLAATLIGGLLRVAGKEMWRSILEERILSLGGPDNDVLDVLKVSFDYLPSASIKKCFAYCSIFAKDTEIERDLLIELWMAEGFLLPDLHNQSLMEDIGYQYIKLLLQSFLFEEVRDEFGTRYKMHVMVHLFAESLSPLHQVRYLAIDSFDDKVLNGNTLKFESALVRTLFLIHGMSIDELLKFKSLHVLNLSGAELKELPTSIGKLMHLRLLDISNSGIRILPDSLCKLYNLQTLRMKECRDLIALPKGMSNLISLRHLHYYNADANFQMPLQMGLLTSLQTLEFFNIGLEKGRQIGELRNLKYLRGKLAISNLELVNAKEGAEQASLFGKPYLLSLRFEWGSGRSRDGANCDEDVLEGLEPHPNLEELVIKNYNGERLPEWLKNRPSNLAKLILIDCKRCMELPPLRQLLSLQNVEFSGLENITCIDLSFCGIDDFTGGSGRTMSSSHAVSKHLFPALKTLCLRKMENLVELMVAESTAGHLFPRLESFSIKYCSKLTYLPDGILDCSTSLQKLEVCGCPNLVSFALDLHQMPLLSRFWLYDCPELITVPTGFRSLTSLREVRIGPFADDSSFNKFDWAGLISSSTVLELGLYGLPQENCLPHQLQHLTTLTNLQLHDFGVEVLPDWLGNLASLQRLYIGSCEKLRCLPSMDAMRRLTKLISLDIRGCPLLMEAPESEQSKISHIAECQIH